MDDSHKLEYLKLIKDITQASDLDELKNLVSTANEFIKKSKLKNTSEEYNKIINIVDIIKFKLKSKKKHKHESLESKKYVISEKQYNDIINYLSENNSRTQEIIDNILDQISEFGIDSLDASQLKKLEDYKLGKSLDYDKPKMRDKKIVKFENNLQGIPKMTFTLMDTVETTEGFEYLGDFEFMDKEYVGFFIVNNDNEVVGIEFENMDSKTDLLVDAEGLEHEIVLFFDGIAEGLSDEDLESNNY